MKHWRRRLFVLFLLSLAVLNAVAVPGAAQQTVRVFLHGDQVSFPDQMPVIVDGRTLVPIRGVFEALGAQVKWDPEALRVTVIWKGNQAAVFIGTRTAWVNGQQRTLDVAPRIIRNRTMVPLRFLAEALGLTVKWYDSYQSVVIGRRPALPVLAPAVDPSLVMPCTIRVAVRPVPKGRRDPLDTGGYDMKEVELSEYVVRVLAHEFGDYTDVNGARHSFTVEPLKAGAVAVLTYAWTHAWDPAKPDYDLDNSTNFQVYIPDKPYEEKHVEAVRAVWGTYLVRSKTGTVFAPQHGSGWYNGRSQGTDWMNQQGALFLADTKGYNWQQILRYYYTNFEFRKHGRPCAGPH